MAAFGIFDPDPPSSEEESPAGSSSCWSSSADEAKDSGFGQRVVGFLGGRAWNAGGEPGPKTTLFVKWAAPKRRGKSVKLEVEPTDTIATVKAKIQDKEAIPPALQQLSVEGDGELAAWERGLADHRPLSDFK